MAFALAIAGIFGVLSYSVAARSRELGVRLALGAERKDIGWMVLRQAFTPVATGIAVGCLVALGLSRFMASFVFGITTNTVFVPFRPKRRECRVALTSGKNHDGVPLLRRHGRGQTSAGVPGG